MHSMMVYQIQVDLILAIDKVHRRMIQTQVKNVRVSDNAKEVEYVALSPHSERLSGCKHYMRN